MENYTYVNIDREKVKEYIELSNYSQGFII